MNGSMTRVQCKVTFASDTGGSATVNGLHIVRNFSVLQIKIFIKIKNG